MKIFEWVHGKFHHGMDHYKKLYIPHWKDELRQEIADQVVSPTMDLRCVLTIGTLGSSHNYGEIVFHGHEKEVEISSSDRFEQEKGGGKSIIISLKGEEDLVEPLILGESSNGVVEKERTTLAELFAESDEKEMETEVSPSGFAGKFSRHRRRTKESSGAKEEARWMLIKPQARHHDGEGVPLKMAGGEKKPPEINAPAGTNNLDNPSHSKRIRRLISKMARKKIHPEAVGGSEVATCREASANEKRERNHKSKKERSSSKSSTSLPWPLQCHGLPHVAA